MILRSRSPLLICLAAFSFFGLTQSSVGDRLPEFRNCLQICKQENCASGTKSTSIPLHRQALLWDCPAECDYVCQHIITDERVAKKEKVVQFHGKWPFYRFLGIQEPFSVLFSLFNFLAHYNGLSKITSRISASYPLRRYYVLFAYFGMNTWVWSIIFHTRDFRATEQMDYFGAGAGILYGMYYTPIRIFRMDQGGEKAQSVLRAWTVTCVAAYLAHVTYLKWWDWDYSYNMAANVVLAIIQNGLWTWYSFKRYSKSKGFLSFWPGVAIAWIMLALSFELLDFSPIWGCVDAHSLWHAMTVGPTIIWYNFLIQDASDDISGKNGLKA